MAFVREVEAADVLQRAGVKVPAVLDLDIGATTVTFDFIPGEVVREKLAVAGARLRDRDVDLPRGPLGRRRQTKMRITEGRKVASEVLGAPGVQQILSEIEGAHRAGVVLHDVKYGNIVLARETGEPFLLDFEHARSYPNWGKLANRILRDSDLSKFNQLFGPNALTERRVRSMARTKVLGPVYAPILLEAGIRFGAIWNTDVGDARWRYLLGRNLPPLLGARILDLGANNGFNAIQMLRSGAREVVAVELSAEAIEQGRQVTRLFEWNDNTSYNLRWVQANMAAAPTFELGTFDFVTALCSIYYLEDEDIASVIRYVSSITDTFVLQCNLDRRIARSNPGTFEKASLNYAQKVLAANGFPTLAIIAPPGYSRPLIIGRRS
jgi:SAM-dependent methyltransferase